MKKIKGLKPTAGLIHSAARASGGFFGYWVGIDLRNLQIVTSEKCSVNNIRAQKVAFERLVVNVGFYHDNYICMKDIENDIKKAIIETFRTSSSDDMLHTLAKKAIADLSLENDI